jgi:hypothetical protein
MRKILIYTQIFFLLVLTACAGHSNIKENLSDDMGSPVKEALLKQRINAFWSAFMKEDYETVYNLYDPFFRAKTDKYAFFGQLGKIKYHDFNIQDIKINGNVAKVALNITYSLPTVKLRIQEFSVPKSTTEITETWLYIYDNWYKEYYLYSIEAGIVNY